MSASSSLFHRLIRRPVGLFVVFVTMVVIGLIAYRRIPVQMMPEGIVEPELNVFVIHPGASAQENEEQIARIVEEQLRTLPGVEQIYSRSSEDRVQIGVQFQAATNMDLAKADLRDRLERARTQLPETVEEVGIWSWNQSQMPVMFLAILHPGDSKRTDYLVETVIQRRLEAVDGIGKVDMWGLLGDSVRILLDEDSVRAAQLDLGGLIQRLSADNFAMPMGEVEDGGRRVLLRSDMRFDSFEEIEDYPVGRGLRLADVGEVVEAKSVRNQLFRIDGRYSYYVALQRDSQANVVATCHRLNAALAELDADRRLDEFEFLVLFDQGEFIESSLGQLRTTALWGGGFALIVLLVFLRRLRLTLCVALSIPVSALMAIAWAYFGGGSFNILTMTGITLAIGMLVDNSVVVIENIARLRGEGLPAREAAARGVREVGLAVTLATLTTVIVFLPLIFMTEHPVMRIMFGELGFPLCLALLFSLFVALVFLPVTAARIVGPRRPAAERLARACQAVLAVPLFVVGRAAGLLRLLAFAALRVLHAANRAALAALAPLRWPLALVLVIVVVWRVRDALAARELARPLAELGLQPGQAALAGAVTAVAAGLLALGLALQGFRWFRSRPAAPPPRPARFAPSQVDFLGGLVASNSALLRWTLAHRVAACCLALAFWGSCAVPQKLMTMTAFGEDENTSRIDLEVRLEDDFTLAEASEQFAEYEAWFEARREELGFAHLGTRFDESSGRVSLYWDSAQNAEVLGALRKRLRREAPVRAGQRLLMRGEDENVERSKDLVAFDLRGPRYEKLVELAERAVPVLEAIPGLSSVSTGLETAPEQVEVVFDQDLAERMGVTPEVAFNNIAWALRGWQLPRFQEPGREVPLILEYDSEEIAGLDTLREMQIFTGDSAVPLATVADIEFSRGQTEIRRRNGQATIALTGRVEDPTRLRAVTEAGLTALRSMDLPRGYEVGEEGTERFRQQEEMREILKALVFSIVLVYLVMGILLESWSLPLVVLWTVPFAVTGALWTLFATGTTMDSVGWIGVIILVGVVVNNGIVLIDRIHSLHQAGMPRAEAVLQGSANRVRPIVMTALTTVCGLLPMALAEPPSEGIDYRALATCVAGGLAISTFFTLWVIPLWYTIVLDLADATSRAVRWAAGPLSGRRARGARGKAAAAEA